MGQAWQGGRFDRLVELGGASAFALGCVYAAAKLAPSFAVPPLAAAIAAGATFFAIGLLVMRTAPSRPAEYVLADFTVAPVEGEELLLDAPLLELLLLDTPYEVVDDDVLLLEVALPRPDPASRVVQLFASPPMPAPRQLGDRVEQHLAVAPDRAPAGLPDAVAALHAALDDLRRSLR